MPITMKLGHYNWKVTAVVGARDAEALYCGDYHVAEIAVMGTGIHWKVDAVPELGLEAAEGLHGAHLDRPFFSREGYEETRRMVNDMVRAAQPTASIYDLPIPAYQAGHMRPASN